MHDLDWSHAEALRARLTGVFAPYIALSRQRTQAPAARLSVDWDLMATEITTDVHSEPFAAYGYMSEGMGKGYQWAEAVLRGHGPDGLPRTVALGGFLCPGNTHPPACVPHLQQLTEAALGQPRRRPNLLAGRIDLLRQNLAAQRSRVTTLQTQLTFGVLQQPPLPGFSWFGLALPESVPRAA